MSGVSKCRRASCSRRCPDGDWMYCMIRRINRFIANTSFSGLVSIVTTARYGASSYSTRERAACGDPAWGLSTGRGRVYGIGAMNCVPTVHDSADVSRRKVWLWHLVETIVFSSPASTMPPLVESRPGMPSWQTWPGQPPAPDAATHRGRRVDPHRSTVDRSSGPLSCWQRLDASATVWLLSGVVGAAGVGLGTSKGSRVPSGVNLHDKWHHSCELSGTF